MIVILRKILNKIQCLFTKFQYFDKKILNIKGENYSINEVTKFLKKFRPIQTNHSLIRIGGKNDGGYLVPDDLEKISGLVSPGVGSTSQFELFFAKKGISCVLIDPTVDELPINHKNFKHIKKYLGTKSDLSNITLIEVLDTLDNNDKNLVLQMNIEGSEYNVLESITIDQLKCFKIIVIEFHDFYRKLNNENFKNTQEIFYDLFQNYHLVHIHPNNSSKRIKVKNIDFSDVFEATFIRNDAVSETLGLSTIPNVLDSRNSGCWKDITINI